jgi:type II secretory pathway component GspD/PulD (secretin)
MDLKALVDYVAESLQINIIGNDALTGSVVLNGPMVIKKDRLLSFLSSVLDGQGFALTHDDSDFYKVMPSNSVGFSVRGDLATTRVIPTPTVKPSTLADTITVQLGAVGVPARINYMDELGVIIATDSPRRLDALSDLVDHILDRSHGQQFLQFKLEHVAASVARQRVLDLLGVQPQTTIIPIAANQPGGAAAALGQTGVITNLSDRLTVNSIGNALIFRGFPEETQRIQEVLEVIDQPNTLTYHQYYAGKGAEQIAQLAERLGLGHIETIETSPTQPASTQFGQPQNQRGNNPQIPLQQQQNQNQTNVGGPVMIVDVSRNSIIYYGTQSQQDQLASLIQKFDTEQELVTIQTIKVKNHDVQDLVDVMNGIVFGTSGPDTSSQFFGGGGFFNNLNRNFGNANNQTGTNRTGTGTTTRPGTTGSTSGTSTNRLTSPATQRSQTGGGTSGNRPYTGAGQNRNQPSGEGAGGLGGDDVLIIADPANSQVIIKAPKGQQEEFAHLVAKLDQRRPQVQIEIQIVSVTSTDDFRLAVEAQAIIGQFAFNTNFGLGQVPGAAGGFSTPNQFTSPKNIASTLSGMTAAFIKSNQVPLIVTALKNNFDSRILSTPQVTVDDNVLAHIESIDEEPTTSTVQGTATTTNSFGGYEQAGTIVDVIPSISEGGYMRLNYDITLSNFVGNGNPVTGTPPAKQTRHVTSESVTIPGDTTIIVGGVKVDSKSSTITKVPLLGDIPLLGYLFRDTSKNNSSTRLYIFITPRILKDANFRDLRLLARGPMLDAGIAADIPPLEPVMIEMATATPTNPNRVPVREHPPQDAPTPANVPLQRPEPSAAPPKEGQGS